MDSKHEYMSETEVLEGELERVRDAFTQALGGASKSYLIFQLRDIFRKSEFQTNSDMLDTIIDYLEKS